MSYSSFSSQSSWSCTDGHWNGARIQGWQNADNNQRWTLTHHIYSQKSFKIKLDWTFGFGTKCKSYLSVGTCLCLPDDVRNIVYTMSRLPNLKCRSQIFEHKFLIYHLEMLNYLICDDSSNTPKVTLLRSLPNLQRLRGRTTTSELMLVDSFSSSLDNL